MREFYHSVSEDGNMFAVRQLVHILMQSVTRPSHGQLTNAVFEIVQNVLLQFALLLAQLQDQTVVAGHRTVDIVPVGCQNYHTARVCVHVFGEFVVGFGVDTVFDLENTCQG